ncbi:MFS transporter [Mycolicibacterium goodii]|uniref:MFS transporter n=1 Tax=Mycolicibacterium goodii TaxID=134601 RepID=A0ABS6HJ76_MYCGD|nr:MFS transporter [Mycolicibacterium goodii]MBU8822736.1 MFS transporter [Mycolicibacterium goodii]MBU8838830.1 MFS transporter [Mycolicibacterium goodii]
MSAAANPRWCSGALSKRVFRRLFAAQVVALVGTGLLTVALGLLAYDLAGSQAGAVLGTALAIKMVAYVAVAPLMAAVTDRIPRRALLVGTDVVRGSVALMLPFVDAAWQIYVLVFVLQAASATFTPAFQSAIPSVLVDEDDYTQALAMSRLAYDLESLLSPMLAAALLTVISYHALFLGTVGGFAASAMLVLSARLPAMPMTARPARLRDRILAGVRVMVARQELRALLALNLAVGAATGLVVVNTVIYVRDLLGASQSGLAVALACYGGGSMIVALTVPRVLRTVADRPVMLAGAVTAAVGLAATTMFIAVHPAPPVGWIALGGLWVALGAATSMINTPAARLLRRNSTTDNRTAVFTAQFSLSHACFLLTYPVAGWVGATLSQPIAALVLTMIATLAAATALMLWRPTRGAAGRREGDADDPHSTARTAVAVAAGQPAP